MRPNQPRMNNNVGLLVICHYLFHKNEAVVHYCSTFTVRFSRLALARTVSVMLQRTSQLETCKGCKDVVQKAVVHGIFQTEEKKNQIKRC